ncbi:MAG: hypothetical protein ACLS3V_00905 [Streptococcus sp.]
MSWNATNRVAWLMSNQTRRGGCRVCESEASKYKYDDAKFQGVGGDGLLHNSRQVVKVQMMMMRTMKDSDNEDNDK